MPVKYFDIVGKQVGRDSAGSMQRKSDQFGVNGAGTHDSGYAGFADPAQQQQPTHQILPQPQRTSRMMGKGGMVYGVVMFDFEAERPDELQAKEGETIIVIAQSNPEWFVAKPISRLGGPGLIPVSFIEIRDLTTNQAVPDPLEAVRRAGVPTVEDWKMRAADYKNCSIPLGKLDAVPSMPNAQMGRLSMDSQRQQQQGMPYGSQVCLSSLMTRANANQDLQQSLPHRPQGNGVQHFSAQPVAPHVAKVPRYIYVDEIFWFIVEASMEDGSHWCLQRVYQDFYDLQISLIQEYPKEAGNVPGHERSLPYMPGPVTYVTDNISNGRRANLDEYLRNLLKLGPHITKGDLVKKFFAPRKGDYELNPEAADSYRLSAGSQDSPIGQPGSGYVSPQSSAGQLSNGQYGQNPYAANYGPPQSQGLRSQPGYASNTPPPPGTSHSNHSMPPPSQVPQHTRNQSSANNIQLGPAIKIKVWYGSDNCVVIRLPSGFTFSDLYTKLQERSKIENFPGPGGAAELDVSVKDEQSGQLLRIRGDDELARAMQRNPKLTLSVSAMLGGPKAPVYQQNFDPARRAAVEQALAQTRH